MLLGCRRSRRIPTLTPAMGDDNKDDERVDAGLEPRPDERSQDDDRESRGKDNKEGEGSADESASAALSKTTNGAPKRKHAKKPAIDYDRHIEMARDLMKTAGKQLCAARATERNEQSEKSRLIKKAYNLTFEDLDRIQVLKRCGMMNQGIACASGSASSGAGSSGAP